MAGVLAVALTACSDADDAPDPEASDGSSENQGPEEGVAAEGGEYVTGTSEDWMEVVCPGAWKASSTEYSSRGGDDREPGGFHCDQRNNGDDYKYTELYFYKTDPTEYWDGYRDRTDEESFANYAIGRVSESEWAVFWEDTSRAESEDPDLPGLEAFGFEVYANVQGAG